MQIYQKVNDYFCPTFVIEDIDGIFKGLHLRHKMQVDSKSSREGVRLMQLGFPGSFRYDSGTSTQHFEKWKCLSAGALFLMESYELCMKSDWIH